MECKFYRDCPETSEQIVLIETLWNVNSNSNRNANFCVSVLIETLWNVNVLRHGVRTNTTRVLIETLWNVNKDTS